MEEDKNIRMECIRFALGMFSTNQALAVANVTLSATKAAGAVHAEEVLVEAKKLYSWVTGK